MFKCDTGYQPEAEVSTCLHNGSWDPVPQCKGMPQVFLCVICVYQQD